MQETKTKTYVVTSHLIWKITQNLWDFREFLTRAHLEAVTDQNHERAEELTGKIISTESLHQAITKECQNDNV